MWTAVVIDTVWSISISLRARYDWWQSKDLGEAVIRIEIKTDLREVTKELLTRQPEWAPLLLSCVQLAQESSDGELDASAVRNRAQRIGWPLAPLKGLGIVEKAGPARKKGHVGVYRLCEPKAIEDALVERGYDVHAKLPGDFFDLHRRWRRGAS